jgi:hypothetical protein
MRDDGEATVIVARQHGQVARNASSRLRGSAGSPDLPNPALKSAGHRRW